MINRQENCVIFDLDAHGIDAEIQSCLLEFFEAAIKSISPTLVHEARFNTSDFATAKERGCDGFDFVVRRVFVDGQVRWRGQFELGDKWLNVTGRLDSHQAETQSQFV